MAVSIPDLVGRCCMTAALFTVAISSDLMGRDGLPLSREDALRAHEAARQRATSSLPVVEYTTHNRGNIQLALANNGTFGTYGQDETDPFTGQTIPSCIYPKNSDLVYLWVGAFWIGAVVGEDTLVSCGTDDFYGTEEFWADPDLPPGPDFYDGFQYRSIDPQSRFYSRDAYSEQDIYCEYTDTFTNQAFVHPDETDNRPHRPLFIKVHQRTMAWSYSYADDFILFDYLIENIGPKTLRDVYMGIWVDGDVWHTSRNNPEGWNDDIVGFYRSHPAPEGCGFIDTVNIAYHADNDGDPVSGEWDYRSARSAVGTRVIRTPSDSLSYSFNWWIINYTDPRLDFGPRKVGTPLDPFRDMNGRLGTPTGDNNKYYLLSHPEFDYDLLFTGIDHSDSGWLRPPSNADVIARGYDTRYLLSFGPFTVEPGMQLPISFAWVGGEGFHRVASDFDNYFSASNPYPYYNKLDFSNLATNSRWASWVYDNPGVDSDNDGYAGKFRVCVSDSLLIRIDTLVAGSDTTFDSVFRSSAADTVYYEGDGVPDFRGAGPPPAPYLKVTSQLGKLVVRFNGFRSETTKDVFLGQVDFEGYRVYAGLDDRQASLSLLSSWDREDYNRYVWKVGLGQGQWVLEDTPFSLDSLRKLFGADFNPLDYPRSRPMASGGNVFFFESQDFNVSDLTSPTGIHKVYPDVPVPPHDSSLWTAEDITLEHGIPLPKYYEYEFILDQVQPTVSYHIAVTAFDFGSPKAGLSALETSPINNMVAEYPLVASDTVEALRLGAYVYPNPYRVDADYAAAGYENRDRSLAPEHARRIHFANLPKVCTISIYSLDGDLVQEIDHRFSDGDSESMHDEWDLISRNHQAIASGIYYYVIESRDRTQIGKFVVIK